MAEQKGIGSKLLGLFVEKEGDGSEETPEPTGEKSAADLVAELANQTAPGGPRPKGMAGAAPMPDLAPPPNLKLDKITANTGDKVDFDQIFRDGGLDPADLDRVKKAEELLKGLPEGTPHEVKKQIVEATLRAIGFEVVKIIQAASTQLRALDVFVKANTDLTAKAITDADTQIKQLNEKITALRSDIEKRSSQLAARTSAATARKGDVQKVLDFFGQPPPPAPKP
jgi:hypothetical protein